MLVPVRASRRLTNLSTKSLPHLVVFRKAALCSYFQILGRMVMLIEDWGPSADLATEICAPIPPDNPDSHVSFRSDRAISTMRRMISVLETASLC